MPDQIGCYASLKNAAGKVFGYLASITLTGTDGKTITVTQDTSLDEAVAMSSKAPKANPVLTGTTIIGNSGASTGGLQGANSFSVSVPTATPTTLFDCASFQSYNDALLFLGGNDNTGAFVGLTTRGGDGVAVVVLLLGKGAGLALSMSGTNVQLTHTIGSTSTFYGKILRITSMG